MNSLYLLLVYSLQFRLVNKGHVFPIFTQKWMYNNKYCVCVFSCTPNNCVVHEPFAIELARIIVIIKTSLRFQNHVVCWHVNVTTGTCFVYIKCIKFVSNNMSFFSCTNMSITANVTVDKKTLVRILSLCKVKEKVNNTW